METRLWIRWVGNQGLGSPSVHGGDERVPGGLKWTEPLAARVFPGGRLLGGEDSSAHGPLGGGGRACYPWDWVSFSMRAGPVGVGTAIHPHGTLSLLTVAPTSAGTKSQSPLGPTGSSMGSRSWAGPQCRGGGGRREDLPWKMPVEPLWGPALGDGPGSPSACLQVQVRVEC